jgi:hypothetical protein
MQKKILLNGFLIDVEVPSEERLTVHVNLTTMVGYATHLTWVSEMQDLMSRIDQTYRERYSKRRFGRGRSVRVRYVKAPDQTQIKIAECQPYPSIFINQLKEVRKQVYAILNTYCLILQEEKVGRMTRKVYFLPATFAPQLMVEIDNQNKRLETIQKHLTSFETTSYFASVLTQIQKAMPKMEFKSSIPHIRVAPVPLSLSRKFFESYVEDEAKKAIEEVDDAKRRGLELLKNEMERRREEMITAINKNLQDKLVGFIQDTEEAVKQFLTTGRARKKASTRFAKLVDLVDNVGADKKPFEALSNVYAALESKDKTAISNAVAELANTFGMQASGDTLANLKAVSTKARGKSMLLMTID